MGYATPVPGLASPHAYRGPRTAGGPDGRPSSPSPVPGAKERLLLAVLAAGAPGVVSTDRARRDALERRPAGLGAQVAAGPRGPAAQLARARPAEGLDRALRGPPRAPATRWRWTAATSMRSAWATRRAGPRGARLGRPAQAARHAPPRRRAVAGRAVRRLARGALRRGGAAAAGRGPGRCRGRAPGGAARARPARRRRPGAGAAGRRGAAAGGLVAAADARPLPRRPAGRRAGRRPPRPGPARRGARRGARARRCGQMEAAILAQDPALERAPTAQPVGEAPSPAHRRLPVQGPGLLPAGRRPLFHGRRRLVASLVARLVDAPVARRLRAERRGQVLGRCGPGSCPRSPPAPSRAAGRGSRSS